MVDLLTFRPVPTRRLPVLTYEQLVRDAVRTAVRPVKGNGSPVIQPGYRLGMKPGNWNKRFPAEVLTPGEVQALLDACPKTGATGMRNRSLIVLLYRTGLRISEALALYPKDIDPDRGTVTVLCGKGSKRRTVGIDRFAVAYVDLWLDWRLERKQIDRYAPVFCTFARGFDCRPINPAYVRRALKGLGGKAGIAKRIHPHGLRHSCAAELATERLDLRVIQAQLGHSSIATTDRYISHLAPTAVVEAIGARVCPLERQS